MIGNRKKDLLKKIQESYLKKQVLKEEATPEQEALAKKTGKSRSHIANLIRLLSLDNYVIGLLEQKNRYGACQGVTDFKQTFTKNLCR